MLRLTFRRALRAGSVHERAFSTMMREPGVVGLPEDPNPRQTLSELYAQTLEAIKEIPESAAYRTNVENIVKYRLDVVNSTDDIEAIEATLNLGQVPEIIEQAQDELELIPHMLRWKPWESDSKPTVIQIVE